MLELKFVRTREMEQDGDYRKDTVYTIGGYTVIDSHETYGEGGEYHSMYVHITDRRNESGVNKYLPEIYFDGSFKHKDAHFRIQTTSYGALESEEYMNFLAAQWTALDVVSTLNAKFLNSDKLVILK